ncbi:DNA repair protein RecN [Acetobacterium sp. KB-1]|jgi:DNA repair protein RecN (Recombination protein N)|uniref:DNA repair protein RecN n=1 Tax=Acetobacterium sp. KB-1 TaxID=2184575 RepID=UPI000DBEC08C|nr:DNA repair protein RecN [Acetobacterium sp. KB-1]AWW28227.1 DNA repair protein RecN [Acetobacterium sp. KB-1]
MLRNLVVNDYALIDYLSVDFDPRLNVITGETGAGKSIVIDALTLVLGNRGNKTNIRQGKHKMTVQGLFDISEQPGLINKCEEYGIPMEEEQLILTREMDDRGRNICRANGLIITVAQLKKLGDKLIDIHGQHEHQSLFKRENHRQLLDAFGGEKSRKYREQAAAAAIEIKRIKDQIAELETNERELEREKENLQFEINEIEVAALRIGEDEELEGEKRILENRERLFTHTSQAYELLRGENSNQPMILDALGLLTESIAEIAKIDSSFEAKLETVNGMLSEAENLSFEIRSYLEDMEYSLGDLDEIESRLSIIARLKRKYGQDIAEILTYAEEIGIRLKSLLNRDESLQHYYQELSGIQDKYYTISNNLYELRLKTAGALKTALQKELGELAMEKVQVEIAVEHDLSRVAAHGQDTVEFLISVNPGQAPKPLGKVASGGEISRIMLSLKSIFGGLDAIETMVFDEIDTGISGRTAQVVAEKIQALSVTSPRGRQIICITHLPQIAAMADQHFMVEKTAVNDSVEVSFLPLDEKGKKEELSRMLGGAEVTRKTWEHAQEMLELSQKIKKTKKSKEDKILS